MTEIDTHIINIKNLIENNIIEIRKRSIQVKWGKLFTYWQVGRKVVKVQKEDKIKYGCFHKKMSNELTKLYGNGYKYNDVFRMRQLYLVFLKVALLEQYLT